jgi:hypothetical protein
VSWSIQVISRLKLKKLSFCSKPFLATYKVSKIAQNTNKKAEIFKSEKHGKKGKLATKVNTIKLPFKKGKTVKQEEI